MKINTIFLSTPPNPLLKIRGGKFTLFPSFFPTIGWSALGGKEGKKGSSDRGVALITVVIIMLTVALLGASLVELVTAVNLSSQSVVEQAKARYLAEAGIAVAIHQLRTNAGSDAVKDGKIGPVTLGDGTYTVIFNVSEDLITSIGMVNGISKKLQLQYNVF